MDWSTLVSTLIGASAALAGGFLAPWLSMRWERQQWRRGKLVEACETYADLVIQGLSNLQISPLSAPHHAEAHGKTLRGLEEVSRTLRVYASPALHEAVRETNKLFRGAIESLNAPENSLLGTPDSTRLKFSQQAGNTLDLIRLELGVDRRRALRG